MHTNTGTTNAGTPDTCSLALDGAVATLTLHRPASRNALSLALIQSLRQRVQELAQACTCDNPPRVAVLLGEGKAFCAGMDLKAVLGDAHAPLALLAALAEATIQIRALPCVTVAKVRGAAIGGGCGLACVCDIAITHADSKMGYPEVDLGVCPAVVAPWLVQKIGAGRARKVLLTGGLMSGREAHAMGMVDVLVEGETQLDEACAALVQRLALGGAHALAATKGLLNTLEGSGSNEELSSAVREGARLSAQIVQSPQTQALLRERLK